MPLLQQMLGKGVKVAETLRECFADNAQMLDLVTDEIVGRFVQLIRETGRESYFIEFLMVLCECHGKAVRHNQWRVCRLFLQEAPELLFKLRLKPNGEVWISGDPRFFPAFREAPEIEFSLWLGTKAVPANAAYFKYTLELYALLVRGRNVRNAKAVQVRSHGAAD